jgi:hypothetical protein
MESEEIRELRATLLKLKQELVLDTGDLVFQEQLFLLQPFQLELIGATGLLKRIDGAVEVAVLLLEPEQRRPELANLLALHRTSPAPCLPPGTAESIAANRGRRKGLGAVCPPLWGVDERARSDSGPQCGIRQIIVDLTQWIARDQLIGGPIWRLTHTS